MDDGVQATSDCADFDRLHREALALRDAVARGGEDLLASWNIDAEQSDFGSGARNLAHYLTLRRHDLNELQLRLAALGLSSLGRSEGHVMPTLDALIATLSRLCGRSDAAYPDPMSFRAGEEALRAACAQIFGEPQGDARTSIMATLPTEAASDPSLVDRLMQAGMDCARINCGHDDADTWSQMIANIRATAARHGRSCHILMDIAGPKCRIEKVKAEKERRVHRGDRLSVVKRIASAGDDMVAFTLNFPRIIEQLVVGALIHIDDGKASGRVVSLFDGGAEIEIIAARPKGVRLKPDKGVNFPTIEMDLPPLTAKDFRDLDFVARHADMVGFSFVQRPSDIELLQDHLAARRGAAKAQALVLKIETPRAVHNLPRLIVQSAIHNPTAVMIARGDLAVELGFARLSEAQEEILWLCEAAQIPVIWATQVLDQFVKEGVESRAETTDAAMSQRADCVMLNKGAFLAQGVAFLRDVLSRMDRHHAKKFPRFTPLHAWD